MAKMSECEKIMHITLTQLRGYLVEIVEKRPGKWVEFGVIEHDFAIAHRRSSGCLLKPKGTLRAATTLAPSRPRSISRNASATPFKASTSLGTPVREPVNGNG